MTYITEYSKLHPKEQRQLRFKRAYKHDVPSWDDSMVRLTAEVAARISGRARVLDAGCGHGNYVIDELRDRISYAVGVDVSRDVMSKNTCLDETVVGNIEMLPFPDASFDLVVSLWVLEHLDHPGLVFQEVARVLKPGGYFAFVTPNKRSLLIAFRRLLRYSTAQRLVKMIYGRKEDDTFDVRYRANTLERVRQLAAASGLVCDFLCENADPSYTSFGPVSYRVSAAISRLPFSWARPHVIGVLRKQ